MNALLVAALDYARMGFRVVPLHSPTREGCSCRKAECAHTGKHPRVKDWKQQATTDDATIRRWWTDWPNANIGIVTGGDVLVLDQDDGYLPGPMPDGPRVKTAKGYHYYLQHPNQAIPNHEEEYGDAKMLANMYEGRIVFDHAEKQWYLWGGHSWYADRTGLMRHLIAGQLARQYLHLVAELKPRAHRNSHCNSHPTQNAEPHP